MDALRPSDATWRHHVQDQEEDLVRELMQADDVDAVLARMEGDLFRHLSPVMRKLNAFDAPKSRTPQPQQQQQQQPPSPPPRPIMTQPDMAASSPYPSSRPHNAPPPPPPPLPESPDHRDYWSGRRGAATNTQPQPPTQQQQQQQQGIPASDPHVRRSSFLPPNSASSSAYLGGPYGSDRDGGGTAAAMDAGDFSPAARPPPPAPFLQSAYREHDPLDAYRRPPQPVAAPAAAPPPPPRQDGEAESRVHATMDSWLQPHRDPFMDLPRDSPLSSAQLTNPFSTTRPPTYAAFEAPTAPHTQDGGMLAPPTPGSPWESSGGRYHGGPSGAEARPTSAVGENDSRRAPRVSTLHTLSPPRLSEPRGRGEVGELENASQSRIARQLQLLRNYRELAELCSNTRDPSVDLFHALPSEELARMQAEQLEQLPRREQSPITVNNNYYFDASGSRRGSGGGGGGGGGSGGVSVRRGHSPSRSGRGRVNSSDTAGARSKAGAAPTAGGNSRSVSELLTVDSHPGMTSHHISGTSSSQALRPPLLPSPRVVPLQSPQPSSGPDSPVATPPLSQRGAPLAPPSPSRSYRGRSHRSRHYDPHDTPTATTEEAGSSYGDDDDVAGDEEEGEYAGDFIDNDVDDDNGQEEEDDGTAHRPPPPRIIEREQHRRLPNNSAATGDYAMMSSAHPPLSPTTSSQQQQPPQQYLQQHMLPQQQQQQQSGGYPGDYTAIPSGIIMSDFAPGGASRSSMGGVAGSENGRRSVSSAINVLSGDHELRANAQPSVSGMVDSRRGSVSQPPSHTQQQQQQQQQGQITAFNGNNSVPLFPQHPHHHQQQQQHQNQQRRSLSAGSNPRRPRRDGGAYTDPGLGSFSDLQDLRRRGGGGVAGGNSTPEKRYSGTSNGSGRARRGGNNGDPSRRSRRGNADGTNARRPDNRRGAGGRRRGYGGGGDSDGGSGYLDVELDPGSLGSDGYSVSEDDTPGNPQLQTHNPRSSARRQRRQNFPGAATPTNATASTRAGRTPNNASGGGRRGGWEEDSTVHTSRQQRLGTGRRKTDIYSSNAGPRQQQTGARQQQHRPRQQHQRRDGPSGKGPSSPFYDNDGAELNSASTYSYSYTTSSDISDYVARSYFSPIKGQGPASGGRGAGAIGARSPMRGRGVGGMAGTAARSPYRTLSPQQQQQPGSRLRGGASGCYLSPSQMRGRGSAPAAMTARGGLRGLGRGRGGGSGSNVNPSTNTAPYGRGGRGGVRNQPASAERRAVPQNAALDDVGRQSGNAPFGARPPQQQQQQQHTRQTTQLPQETYPTTVGSGGGPMDNAISGWVGRPGQGSPSRSPRRGGLPAANAAAATVLLPNGMRVPATSPAAQQYRQLLQQQQQMLHMQGMGSVPEAGMGGVGPGSSVGWTPSASVAPQPFGLPSASGFYPAGLSAVSRTPQQSPATSPVRGAGRGRRAMSPSVAASNAPGNRSTMSAAGGTAVHIHPGLLYGSLLPKARAKTALVVEEDVDGRERSVSPHGDATHAPFLDRGSVCPVQPAVPTFTPAPPRTTFTVPQPDFFPVSGAVNGATADGVQPLAWKSGGSGCVVGRTGHLPPPPSTKLSSHNVPPNTTPQQQQQQRQVVVSILQPPQQQFHALRQSGMGRRDSAFSLQSYDVGGGGGGGGNGAGRGAEVVDPYTPRGRAAAERSANLQRFGIAPVQG